jgi:glutamate-1-semialdehyde 2,1-aminomutase
MPIGAVGGRREVMECLAPLGPVYQAGTLSGNPVAVAAGLATLKLLDEEDPYPRLERLGRRLAEGLDGIARQSGLPMHCARMGSMFTPFFCMGPVNDRAGADACDKEAHARFFHGMLDRGIYLPPSQFELGFISAAHDENDVELFLDAAGEALREPASGDS